MESNATSSSSVTGPVSSVDCLRRTIPSVPSIRWNRSRMPPTNMLSAQIDFSECLAAMRRKWTGESADACRHLFAHLFWIYRGDERYQIIDLGEMKCPWGLDVAWGLETTRKFGEVARRVDPRWMSLGPFPTGKQYRFKTHEEFAEYGGFWLLVTVRLAVQHGQGPCRCRLRLKRFDPRRKG